MQCALFLQLGPLLITYLSWPFWFLQDSQHLFLLSWYKKQNLLHIFLLVTLYPPRLCSSEPTCRAKLTDKQTVLAYFTIHGVSLLMLVISEGYYTVRQSICRRLWGSCCVHLLTRFARPNKFAA